MIQSIPVTTISSGAKEQIKGGGGEEEKNIELLWVLVPDHLFILRVLHLKVGDL